MSIKYEISNKIATVTFDRPQKANALDLRMRIDFVEALKNANDNEDVRVVIITGAGGIFSAGYDLDELAADDFRAKSKIEDPGAIGAYEAVKTCRKPTISAINGPCLAQGAGLALLTDVRFAARRAKFGWPQVKRGLVSVSGTVLLSRMVPTNIAFEYLFTGKEFSVEQAFEYGMVNKITDDGQSLSAAMDFAEQLVANAPLSIEMIKKVCSVTSKLSISDALVISDQMTSVIMNSEDAREGVQAFREKRLPVWKGK